MASDRVVEFYRKHAASWATDRRKQNFFERGWLDQFCRLLPDGAAVLDIGCGFGAPIASYLIKKGYAVTGADSSPEMIAMCRARFPDAAWQIADMRTLVLGSIFQGLLAWDSFFHLTPEDQRRMFSVFRSHAAPGAALMFTSGTGHGVAMGQLYGDPLYHASLSLDEYRILLDAHGFEVLENAIEDPDCGHRTVWLAKLK